mmetsp:Transcript_36988/g.51014  ORF Transcript_36988/g.51014 Transcript_36988/m.51014 type:complete len:119 (+) Transcript_36988:100-456(+)
MGGKEEGEGKEEVKLEFETYGSDWMIDEFTSKKGEMVVPRKDEKQKIKQRKREPSFSFEEREGGKEEGSSESIKNEGGREGGNKVLHSLAKKIDIKKDPIENETRKLERAKKKEFFAD